MELAISYKRFSSLAQAKGRSEGRQGDETEEYCCRKGYKIVETFVDRGFSAYTGENSDKGDLKAILDLAAAGKIKPGTHLVVESLDRISRQEITAALSLFLNIINLGLAIDTTFDEQIYTKERCDADPFAAMGAILVLIRGHNESKTKSKRIKDARAGDRKNAREHKIPVNSRCPAWLTVVGLRGENRKFEKRDDLVAIIILVFQAYDGGLGCISVAKLLNRNKIKSLSGKTWSAGTVQRLLRNEAVIGVYQPQVYIRKRKRVPDGQGKVEGYYPEIISAALFYRVQQKLDANKNYGKDRRNYGGGQKLSAANLVAGIGWCENGHKLTYRDSGNSVRTNGKRRKQTIYLRCRESLYGACGNRVGFPYQRFEEMLLSVVGVGLQKIVGSVIPEPDTTELVKRVADIEATIARKRQAIQLNTAELFELPAGPLREAMKRQLGHAAAEIEQHETELQSAREAARMIEHENSHSSIARFQAAKAKLNSVDTEERLAARRKLALELRLRINRVELQRDRTMLVRFNDGCGGERLVELSFTTERLNGIRCVYAGRSFPIEKATERALIEAHAT
jgi:DNA invertase Pin-like site-specific DNA recombinase